MKHPYHLIATLLLCLASSGLPGAPLGTAFTYQGRLADGGNAVNGLYELRLGLFTVSMGGIHTGNLLTNKNLAVSNGLFTTSIDFGPGVFDSTAYWLEIGARTNGSQADFSTLSPRQPLTASPYALYATNAGAAAVAAIANGVAPGSVAGAGIQNATIGAAKLAGGQVVKSLNSLKDDVVFAVQAPLALSTNGNALQLSASVGLSWNLSGNGGMTGANFLGTLDSQPLELRVNNARILRLEPTSDTPNFIGGFSGNYAQPGLPGVTIGGGGTAVGNQPNVVTNNGYYATIAGGYRNAIGGYGGAILGGSVNLASGNFDTIGGGQFHTASGAYDTVAGGSRNQATNDYASVAGGNGNTAGGLYSSVGGGYGNVASGSSSVVAGGGIPFIFGGSLANTASGDYGVVSGGLFNVANTNFCTVSGGGANTASGFASVVAGGGGLDNQFNGFGNTASGAWSAVGGGKNNIASGPEASVGGGEANWAEGDWSTIGGGNVNIIAPDSWAATIGGGQYNRALSRFSTVAGGHSNLASNENNTLTPVPATVSGGSYNRAMANSTTVGGGNANTASASGATVAGGGGNVAAGGGSTVGGGTENHALGDDSTIPGGYKNRVLNGSGFAAGYYASSSGGSIVFSTGVWTNRVFINPAPTYFESATTNEFAVLASGGVRFVSDYNVNTGAPTTGVYLPHADGSWHTLSDRNAKEDAASVNPREILERLTTLPVQTWRYKGQEKSVRHIGPMAQDFQAAFGVGIDDKHIATVDADGVALAAIQGLHELVKEKEFQIQKLQSANSELEKRLTALEDLVSTSLGSR